MDAIVWIRAQMTLIDAASAVVSFAANWLFQSTILIAAGLAVGRLLRSRGSALQSAIYRTTLAAAIGCPLATSLLSLWGVGGWSLEMPVAWTYVQLRSPARDHASPPAAIDLAPPPRSGSLADDAAQAATASFYADAARRGITFEPEPPREMFSNEPAHARAAARLASGNMPARRSSSVPGRAPSTHPVGLAEFHVGAFGLAAVGIALLWLAASTVLLLRLALAWRRLNRLRGDAAPADSATERACRDVAALLEVAAPEVLRSPYLASPCLAGVLHPVVLLPDAAPSLPLRDVLIHELAHLRRRDGSWNLLQRISEAFFFYQPLLWMLTRRLETVAEEVCDDYVVHFGGDREEYARGLVKIAELSSLPAGAAIVAMVSLRSILAQRVVRIMDSSRSLSTRAGNLLLAVVIAGGLAGTTIVGFVGLGPQPPLANAQPMPAVATGAAGEQADTTTADGEAGAAEGEVTAEVDKVSNAEADGKQSDVAEKASEPAENKEPAAENQLRGSVTGADGKRVAGAKLYWLRTRVHDINPQPPQLAATTDNDGRFRFAEPPAVPENAPARWNYSDRIVLVAPGHGFAFTSPGGIRDAVNRPNGALSALARAMIGGPQEPTSLPKAGEPIRGRLVDVNGQPVAGAKIRIRWFSDDGDLRGDLKEAEARGAEDPAWHARVADLLNVIEPVQLRDVLPGATTDAAGRFELRDIGTKRLVQLLVEGEGIESTEIVARNEPGEKLVVASDRHEQGGSLAVYANEFLYAVGPSKPVEGRVLDLDTGKPIAGAVVRAFQVHGERVSSSREREHFASSTDAAGRYRITGLPIGKENSLVAFATGDAAYLPVGHAVDTSAPGAAIQRDFRLKRGVWAEGRVFDAETRKPFTGEISYYFFRDRKWEEAVPGVREAYVDGLYWTNANGEFRVPVLPTRGILAFRYDGWDRDSIDRFARGFGAQQIAGSEAFGGGKTFPTAPHHLMPTNYERVAEVPATDGQKTVRVDMPLFASRPVAVRVVDPDGKSVTQYQAYGANERFGWQTREGPQFEVQDLRPGERRKVFVFHRDRNLAGGGFVPHGTTETVEIKLVAAGSVQGRLLDAGGEAIDDATLLAPLEKLNSSDDSAIWAPHPDLRANPTNIPVDKAGRFRLDGLIPGWSYHAFASAPRPNQGETMSIIIGSTFKDVQVEVGEKKDLGDLVIGADQPD